MAGLIEHILRSLDALAGDRVPDSAFDDDMRYLGWMADEIIAAEPDPRWVESQLDHAGMEPTRCEDGAR